MEIETQRDKTEIGSASKKIIFIAIVSLFPAKTIEYLEDKSRFDLKAIHSLNLLPYLFEVFALFEAFASISLPIASNRDIIIPFLGLRGRLVQSLLCRTRAKFH